MLIKFMFLSAFTFIGSYNHLCDVMMTHLAYRDTQSPSTSAMKCLLSFLSHSESISRFRELTRVARCGKKLASFPGLPTVQFVIICKQSKTGRYIGRRGNEASKKSLA